MEDLSSYEKLRNDAQKFYVGMHPIESPALGEFVHFTAEGFNHIIFKGARSERERPSQIDTPFQTASESNKTHRSFHDLSGI